MEVSKVGNSSIRAFPLNSRLGEFFSTTFRTSGILPFCHATAVREGQSGQPDQLAGSLAEEDRVFVNCWVGSANDPPALTI
jgi:hypothetical protein